MSGDLEKLAYVKQRVSWDRATTLDLKIAILYLIDIVTGLVTAEHDVHGTTEHGPNCALDPDHDGPCSDSPLYPMEQRNAMARELNQIMSADSFISMRLGGRIDAIIDWHLARLGQPL